MVAKEIPQGPECASGKPNVTPLMTDRPISADAPLPVLSGEHALFLDFDGTLAPIQDDPETVALPSGGAALLLTLSNMLDGALVLISGRSIHDLASRTPPELWRAGGHGRDVCAPGQLPAPNSEKASAEFMNSVYDVTRQFEGVWVEEKGKVLAIHYRQNPSVGDQLAAQLELLVSRIAGYKFQHGKMVIELKPAGTDKGTALRSLMRQTPFAGRNPVMVGDDTTDEDAMLAAMDLGGFGIKVGEGQTCARYQIPDTVAVWGWLKRLLDEHA